MYCCQTTPMHWGRICTVYEAGRTAPLQPALFRRQSPCQQDILGDWSCGGDMELQRISDLTQSSSAATSVGIMRVVIAADVPTLFANYRLWPIY